MPLHHLPLRPSEQRFILCNPARLQTFQNASKIRVCALILFSDPTRNPADQHWIDKHLHQAETPTIIPAVELQVQVSRAKVSV